MAQKTAPLTEALKSLARTLPDTTRSCGDGLITAFVLPRQIEVVCAVLFRSERMAVNAQFLCHLDQMGGE